MKVSDFDFHLAPQNIALRPVRPRDEAKLLVVAPSLLEDRKVLDLPSLLQPNDIVVFNNTKVLPSRLWGQIGTAKAEVTLLQPMKRKMWRALVKPGKKFLVGGWIDFGSIKAVVVEKEESGTVVLKFNSNGLADHMETNGLMPLPPYIAKWRTPDQKDRIDYQTLYAKKKGAVAAPTAGLHFTPRLFKALQTRKIKTAFATLHVGAGTFLPIRVDDFKDHVMHSERGEISSACAKAINSSRSKGGRVIAVGTTTLRLLETVADDRGVVRPWKGDVDLFIYPGYAFKAVDVLFTNFHLPRSTLLLLVSAFSGIAGIKEAYRHALSKNYRFFSYGDACLLHRGLVK